MEGATSISIILLVDVKVESFPPYIYVPTPWVKAHQNYHGGSPSLENLSCCRLDIFFSFSCRPYAKSLQMDGGRRWSIYGSVIGS
jgi:hypothetical protein